MNASRALHWLAAGLICMGCTPAEQPSIDDDEPIVLEVFAAPPDPERIAEVAVIDDDGITRTRAVPADQMVLMFEESISPDQARERLNDMTRDLQTYRLAVVGQVPDLGIYQLRVEPGSDDPQTTLASLDAAIAAVRDYAGVISVGYNEFLTPRAIENDDDNSGITGSDRCAFAAVDYYQAVPLLDEVLPHVSLSDVTVAVIDTGLWTESGQFDDIMPRTQFPDQPATNPIPFDSDPQHHGTTVASLIAADNGDGMMNGIALRVLDERLHLIIGDVDIAGLPGFNFMHVLASAQEAVALGADIINFSLGRHDGGARPAWLVTLQNHFMRLMEASPEVLFVAAASNDRFELNNNDVPAGLPNSNLLTVGGFSSCEFDAVYAQSSTGPGIDVAGPATNVSTCCSGGFPFPTAVVQTNGNSMAAPIVTSIAAIVKAIDPDLSGARLKDYLIAEEQTWPAPAEVGGRRLALLKPVANALLASAASSAVSDIMDTYGGSTDAIADPSGHMTNRMNGAIEFEVAGPDYSVSHTLSADELAWTTATTNYGLIGNHMTVFNMFQGSDTVQGFSTSGFRLNEAYLIYSGGPNGATIHAGAPFGGDFNGGDGRSGSFIYTECELTTRSLPLDWYTPTNPGPHQLVFIEVTGTLNPTTVRGFVESLGEIHDDIDYTADGTFTMAFSLLDPDSATLEHLEEVCIGGYQHEPGS